jgi:class 3 adenylate cyclase
MQLILNHKISPHNRIKTFNKCLYKKEVNMAHGRNRFFLLKILDYIIHRIKTKVIVFEMILILFVAVSIGFIITVYIAQTLTIKAHQLSERIVKDLAQAVEYNYISIPAVDEAVQSFKGTEGILYLGYNGYIISKKAAKEHIYFGINTPLSRNLESVFPDLDDFQMSYSTEEYTKNLSLSSVIIRFLKRAWNDAIYMYRKNILKDKNADYKRVTESEISFFEYYMPVRVNVGPASKKIGYVVLRYSTSIINKEIDHMTFLIEIITGIIIIISIYVSIRGANGIVKPITKLTSVVRQFGDGNLTVRANLPARDEIGVLANTFDQMMLSIREKFEMQKYVSDSTVKMIKRSVTENQPLHEKDKHTERKQVTLFFSDIRGFTSMSEKMDPQGVVDILNEYLDAQSIVIKSYQGDIDKFVGDEIVAVFESDNMCTDAVTAAMEIQRKIALLNIKREKNRLQPVYIGIGINTGEVVKGSIGSHDRMDFTVIGDHVNLASRLCSAAAAGEIIFSRNVFNMLANELRKLAKPLKPIRVKGKDKPIEIYGIEY